MDANLTSVGVGGIFALMILDKVFNFLKTKKNGHDDNNVSMTCPIAGEKVASQVQTMYDMHMVKDEDQVPVWYRRPSLEKKIEALTDQTKRLLERMERNS